MNLSAKTMVMTASLSALFFPLTAAEPTQDRVAYAAGEKLADLMVQQSISLARKDVDSFLEITAKVTSASREYVQKLNLDFFRGTIEGFQRKNIKVTAEKEGLDKQQCAQVLAGCYYFSSLLSKFVNIQKADFSVSEDQETKAFERALMEVYGKATPAMIQELKKSLEAASDFVEDQLEKRFAAAA